MAKMYVHLFMQFHYTFKTSTHTWYHWNIWINFSTSCMISKQIMIIKLNTMQHDEHIFDELIEVDFCSTSIDCIEVWLDFCIIFLFSPLSFAWCAKRPNSIIQIILLDKKQQALIHYSKKKNVGAYVCEYSCTLPSNLLISIFNVEAIW